MPEIPYVVGSGDSLSKIAKKYLGDMHAWPKIFEYNNLPRSVAVTGSRITDPDLILVGQKLLIPVDGPAVTRQTRPATPPPRPAPPPARPRPGARPEGGSRVAVRQCSHPTFEYDLEDLPKMTMYGPGWTATMKMAGSIQIQAKCVSNFLTLKADGFELAAKSKADKVLDSLITRTGKIGYDAKTGDVTFESGMTVNSTNPYAPSTSISSGISTSGKPMIKATVQAKNLKGEYSNHGYWVGELKVIIELELDPQAPTARPRPVPVPIMTQEQVLQVASVVVVGAVIVAAVIFLPATAVAYGTAAAMIAVSVGVGGKLTRGSPIGGSDVPGI